MVAINFPDSPTNGQEHSGYVWDATNNVWNRLPTLPALDLVNFSAVAPSNPQDGQFWFDTTAGKMYVYYNDGSSAQWVSTLGGLVGQTGTDGQFLIHNGTEWVASNFTSPGSILQAVSTTKTDVFTASVAGGAESGDITGLTASITPSSTANKILITGFVFTDKYHTQGFSIYRDATKIGQGDAASNRTRIHSATSREGATNNPTSGAMNFLDSPSSTSSVTYSVRLHNGDSGTQTLYVNRSQADTDTAPFARGVSTITLMEVAG